jgi:AcrR family transcriptional regulator
VSSGAVVTAASAGRGGGTKGVPRAAREEQIVAVAVDEFADRGYAGASMVSIATRAGISKPLIYQYFGSKDGLYLACLDRVANALLERLEPEWEREDDSVMYRLTVLRAFFEALEPQRNAWRLLYDASMPDVGEIAVAAKAYRDRTADVASSGSARFLRARGLDDPADASALSAVWMGLVDSLVTWWVEHPDDTAEAMTARCARLMSAIAQ